MHRIYSLIQTRTVRQGNEREKDRVIDYKERGQVSECVTKLIVNESERMFN